MSLFFFYLPLSAWQNPRTRYNPTSSRLLFRLIPPYKHRQSHHNTIIIAWDFKKKKPEILLQNKALLTRNTSWWRVSERRRMDVPVLPCRRTRAASATKPPAAAPVSAESHRPRFSDPSHPPEIHLTISIIPPFPARQAKVRDVGRRLT